MKTVIIFIAGLSVTVLTATEPVFKCNFDGNCDSVSGKRHCRGNFSRASIASDPETFKIYTPNQPRFIRSDNGKGIFMEPERTNICLFSDFELFGKLSVRKNLPLWKDNFIRKNGVKIGTVTLDETMKVCGRYSLEIALETDMDTYDNVVYQSAIKHELGKRYTTSLYLKTGENFENCKPKVFLQFWLNKLSRSKEWIFRPGSTDSGNIPRWRRFQTSYNGRGNGYYTLYFNLFTRHSFPAKGVLWVDAVQIEETENFASSYIPTGRKPVTRQGEVLKYSSSGNLNKDKGKIVISVKSSPYGNIWNDFLQHYFFDEGHLAIFKDCLNNIVFSDGKNKVKLKCDQFVKTEFYKITAHWDKRKLNVAVKGETNEKNRNTAEFNLNEWMYVGSDSDGHFQADGIIDYIEISQ
ncbi:MAG: hypothetical protein WCS27_02800 [Victivallaceae bacterium]